MTTGPIEALPLAVLPRTAGSLALVDELSATADLHAIVAWAASKRKSEHTRRAFMTEARRFLAWLIWFKVSQGRNHSSWLDKATSMEASAYATFLELPKPNPFPAWVLDLVQLQRQPFNPEPLKLASIQRAISSLRTMYKDMAEMVLDGLQITKSPFNRVDVSFSKSGSPSEKALNYAELGYVAAALKKLERDEKPEVYQRIKWVWTASRWAALRRHELAKAVAGDIRRRNENGALQWIISVLGKGKVEKPVPLSAEFMAGFAEYRAFHGLTTIPMQNELTPLVLPLRGDTRNVVPETINRIIKDLLEQAADIAEKYDDQDAALRLRSFASHSARHTQINLVVNTTGDITLGQQLARHADISTTMRYKAESADRLRAAFGQIDDASIEREATRLAGLAKPGESS